jgi:signal transduction histidine kinase
MGEEAYNSRHALEGILAQFLGMPEITGGWLAIRRGEQLIISAQSDAEVGMDASLELPSSPLMRRIRETRVGLVARRGGPDWSAVPHSLPPAARFWAAYPLVVRERFIGAIALWGERPLPSWRQVELGERAAAVSPQIDLVLSMAEVTSQLHRLATLNEFALAISSAEDFPRMTERVMTHLAAIFPAHRLALYVPSGEGTRMQEFRSEGETFRQVSTAMSGHIMARWFLVSGESANATRSPLLSAGEQLILPLRYREAIVGLLELRGSGTTEVSRYDQSMLAIVGSYMAGVVERNRLRFEATERARRLEETVQQLQQAELTASTRLAAQQSAESRLVQAAKLVAVGEMAAGVAHELNNPLTTVTGFAELILEDTPAGAPYRADLEMVLHEARRARSVVRRLLDFARQGEHLAARADMNEIVEDVLALMTHFIHTSGVQLEVELAPELPWIILDGNQMKQVLLNLLHNALHAMPGGGRLQVRTELQRKEARDWVVTHITDDGVGIDAAELERIFEPFYTTRAESGGTGLGLSVTYGIVSDHGGTIEVESQRGAGSTFSVWLPA